MNDLWPADLATTITSSPITILKEQASLLGMKTKNIVKASVRRIDIHPVTTSRHVASAKTSTAPQAPFNYAFNLVAPALDNYTYRLFTVSFSVDLYPATFSLDDDIDQELGRNDIDGLVAADAADFISHLSRIPGSQKTRKVINAILSQSTDLVRGDGSDSE
jgi:hypothetical protein